MHRKTEILLPVAMSSETITRQMTLLAYNGRSSGLGISITALKSSALSVERMRRAEEHLPWRKMSSWRAR
jgi:hypothetical protein